MRAEIRLTGILRLIFTVDLHFLTDHPTRQAVLADTLQTLKYSCRQNYAKKILDSFKKKKKTDREWPMEDQFMSGMSATAETNTL